MCPAFPLAARDMGQIIRSLYNQRQPLYRRYAQIAIDCTAKTHEQIVAEIAETI